MNQAVIMPETPPRTLHLELTIREPEVVAVHHAQRVCTALREGQRAVVDE